MVGFANGFLIAISTHLKEIGQVGVFFVALIFQFQFKKTF